MANPILNYTYTDANGEIRPTAAVSRELLRRQKGYEADTSFDDTIKYFGLSDKSPESVIESSAQLNEIEVPSAATRYKNDILDKIATGDNEYYNNAASMERPEYESQYDSHINELVDKILNGEKFSYDINGDAVYQQYKSEYERSAKKAADNAMAGASMASGGYANSYAEAAAQQAYNSEMQSLGEMIPEFEAQAYGRYMDEKNDQYNQLSTLMSAENMEYGKHRDEVADFYADRDYELGMGDRYQNDLYNQFDVYQTVEDSDFNKEMTLEDFAFNREKYENDKAYQDAVAAAELGDFSMLGDYLGIDTTEAEKWFDVVRATEMYSATGMISFLKEAGLDTTELEANLSDEKFYNKLTTALAIYEATGDPSKLKELGIDTSYSDQLLKYSLVAAKNSANGSSGSGGSGRSGGGGRSSGYSGGNGSGYNSGGFSGNSTTDYWINQRLTEKQLNNYNEHRNSSVTLEAFAGDQLARALLMGEINKEEFNYLYDHFGIE